MNKVDLIIPTHNRTNYLKELLEYYQRNNLRTNIIIADSSNKLNKSNNKKLVKQYNKLNIEYIDRFPSNLPQSYKFAQMIKYANSKYVCFCADDDFIDPEGIEQSVNFLDKHPDYSTAHGAYIGFYVAKNFFGSKKFLWRLRDYPHTISDSDPLSRLVSHLKNYTLVNWAVRRTTMVKECYKEYEKIKLDPYLLPILGELIPDTLSVIFGKVKTLDIFYGARQYFGSIINHYRNFTDAINEGKYQSEYSKFKDCLLKNLIKTGIPRNRSAKVIDQAIREFIEFSNQEYLTNKIYRLLNPYPKFFSMSIRYLHTRYLFTKKSNNILGLIDNPSSKYFKNFQNIRQSVLERRD